MADKPTRREFLRNASLAGAAVVAGGGALSAAGCCTGGQFKKKVSFGGDGTLFINDRDLENQMRAWLEARDLLEQDPSDRNAWRTKEGKGGIRVIWKDDDRDGFKVNSLCTC